MRPIAGVLFVLLSTAMLTAQAPPPAPTATSTATDGQRPSTIRIDRSGFVLPACPIEVEDLIAATALFLQRNIACDPAELAGVANRPLQLQKELALDALGCEDVVSQLLAMRGLALVPVDADRGLYQVLRTDGPRQGEIAANAPQRAPEAILRRPQLHVYVLTAVPMVHADATEAAKTLRQFFAGSSNRGGQSTQITFGTMGNARTLLIGGYQDQVAVALRLLQACDRPAPTPPPDLDQRLGAIEQLLQRVARHLWPAATTKN